MKWPTNSKIFDSVSVAVILKLLLVSSLQSADKEFLSNTFDPVDHVVDFNLSLDHNQGVSEFTLLGYFQATFQFQFSWYQN